MIWLLLLFLLSVVVLVGPLRRAWRFCIPAVLGATGGIFLTAFLVRFGVPGWAFLFLPPLLALQCGAVGKAWLDANYGPPRS